VQYHSSRMQIDYTRFTNVKLQESHIIQLHKGLPGSLFRLDEKT